MWQARKYQGQRNARCPMSKIRPFEYCDRLSATFASLRTSDGVKAIDIAWLASDRRREVDSAVCLAQAPEICVQILSPSNTGEEISEKIELYFEAGAKEVWICNQSGTVEFYYSGAGQTRRSSEMCPEFPQRIDD